MIGAVLHGFIKGVLFNPLIVCTMLIAGGLVGHYAGKAQQNRTNPFKSTNQL